MSKYCTYCGKQHQSNFNVCANRECRRERNGYKPEDLARICTNCDEPNRQGAIFCEKCGKPLSPKGKEAEPKQYNAVSICKSIRKCLKKPKNHLAIILIAIVGFTSISLLLFRQERILFLPLIFPAAWALGELFKYTVLKNKRNFSFEGRDIIAGISFIVSVIMAVSTPPSFFEQLKLEFFNSENELSLRNEPISKNLGVENNPPKIIFAFDNSAKGLREKITDSSIIKTYNDLLAELNGHIHNNAKLKSLQTYGNLLKLRLCGDLLQLKHINGYFRVMKIGDHTDHPWADDEFIPLSDDRMVNQAIRDVLNSEANTDEDTDFEDFYEKIVLTVALNSGEDYESRKDHGYALYIYSDFYHDTKAIKENVRNIQNYRRYIIRNRIVQNYFIDRHNIKRRENQTEAFILENHDYSTYEIEHSLEEDENKPPFRIIEVEAYWNYRNTNDNHFNITLPGNNCKAKLLLTSDIYNNNFTFNKKIKSVTDWVSFHDDKKFELNYEGAPQELEKQVVSIIIFHDKMHYIVSFRFRKIWDFGAYCILWTVFIMGFLFGILGIRR